MIHGISKKNCQNQNVNAAQSIVRFEDFIAKILILQNYKSCALFAPYEIKILIINTLFFFVLENKHYFNL